MFAPLAMVIYAHLVSSYKFGRLSQFRCILIIPNALAQALPTNRCLDFLCYRHLAIPNISSPKLPKMPDHAQATHDLNQWLVLSFSSSFDCSFWRFRLLGSRDDFHIYELPQKLNV